MRARWVAWDGLGALATRYDCSPTQRTDRRKHLLPFAFSQLRRPTTLLPLSRLWLRVGAVNRAGLPGAGDRPFSSESVQASPATVPPLYYVTPVTASSEAGSLRVWRKC